MGFFFFFFFGIGVGKKDGGACGKLFFLILFSFVENAFW
jgi:hypothetical protein